MIRVSWVAPTKFTSGRVAKPGELTGYILKMKVDGAPNFTEIAKPAANALSFDVQVTDPGTYFFELTASASNGKNSSSGKGQVTITDATALEAPVVSVTIV